MGRKRDRPFWESAAMNNATYNQYSRRLTELCLSRFTWLNLPETVDARFLELTLFEQGQAVFFEDDGGLGFLCLANIGGGEFDVYRTPKQRRAYAVNGYTKNLDETDSVIIYNNFMRTNSLLDVEMFARRLYNIDRTIDVNVNSQKTPILIRCEESQRLTLENLYQKYDGNQMMIFADKSLNPSNFSVLNTQSPYVADKLQELKANLWNEALTYLGITNMTFNKKERLTNDEVMRMQGGAFASRNSPLKARQDACEKINDMFGLDIWCEYAEVSGETEDSEETEVNTDE